MNEQEQKTQQLMDFIYADFQVWKQTKIADAHERGEKLWEDPDVKTYCYKRLGVPPESLSRWTNRLSPVGPMNLLKIAIALGDETPLRIFGFDPLPADLWGILTRLPSATPEERQRIQAILGEKQPGYRMNVTMNPV